MSLHTQVQHLTVLAFINHEANQSVPSLEGSSWFWFLFGGVFLVVIVIVYCCYYSRIWNWQQNPLWCAAFPGSGPGERDCPRMLLTFAVRSSKTHESWRLLWYALSFPMRSYHSIWWAFWLIPRLSALILKMLFWSSLIFSLIFLEVHRSFQVGSWENTT